MIMVLTLISTGNDDDDDDDHDDANSTSCLYVSIIVAMLSLPSSAPS